MKKVFKFVKGKKEVPRESGGVTPSQSRELSSPAQTPEDERFLSLDTSSGYIVDFCGKDKSLTKLHKAAWQGHLEKLKSALKKTEIDAVDRHNRSALHFAVAQGHPNIVWYLLGNNAKMTICDDDGCTPLLKAVECGHKDCMSLLLERGADINNADYQGNTGLHIAAKQGSLDIASTLLSRGAALDVANNCGEYPLHIATRSQNKDLVELLLRNRASVNVFDRENRTPLMLAAKTGNLLLAQLFFEYGAQLTVVDSNGWTAEDYALLGGHESVANELKSYIKSESCKGGGQEVRLETHNEEEESEGAKSNENSGTWNEDGHTSSESKDLLSKRVKNFFQGKMEPGKEKEEEVSDSPESEAMPPPCQPPRSWEMIQAGMIDANQEGSESKRRSITTLGTLHSRRESFTEAGSNQASGETAKYTLSLNRRKPAKRENSFAKQRLSFNEEESMKSWMSDTSSTLREIDRMELDKIRKVESSEGKGGKASGGSGSEWDSECGSVGGVREGEASSGKAGSAGCRSEALNGIEEVWVRAEQAARAEGEDGDRSSWDSEELSSQEAEATFPPPPSGIELGVNMAKSIGYMKGISIDHPVGNVLERNVWKTPYESQSHSVDRLDEKDKAELGKGEAFQERAVPGSRRHVRHQSISGHKWRSEEIPQNQKSMDRLIDVNRRINEQLQCYDQALRELAETPYAKKQEAIVSTLEQPSKAQNYYSLPASKHKTGGTLCASRRDGASDDRYYYEWSRKPLSEGSGPLSLPFCVNVAKAEGKPEAENNEKLGGEAEGRGEGGKKSKRHMLLAMRDVKHAVHVSNTFKTSMDDQILSPLTKPPDSSDSEDNDRSPREREQHFFKSDFTSGRQETVIERPEFRRKSSSSGTGEEPTLWLQDQAVRRENSEEDAPELAEAKEAGPPSGGSSPRSGRGGSRRSSSSSEGRSPRRGSEQGEQEERQQSAHEGHSPDVSFSSGPIEPIGAGKDSGSEADSTHNEVSPNHNYTLQTHHEWLKNHLRSTTSEKNKLEQVAVELSEKTERLQYELADAKEATKSKDEVILLLRNQLERMESAYTKSLEESVRSRLQLTTHEQEILHLKELCFRYEEEKERGTSDGDEDDRAELKSRIRLLEEEKEKMARDILRLEQEKSALEKRLQEATTSEILEQCQRWKERFESLEESAKANDESQSAYLTYLKSLSEEHVEREKKLSERNSHLEKMLLEANERNMELDAKLQSATAELESERLKASLRTELSGSVTEMERRNAEMEGKIRRLEKEVEEKGLQCMREKEEEVQALMRQFAAERDTLVKNYESRLAEVRTEEGDQERESWRKENERLKLTVRHLQEEFENLRVKSTLEETNETLKQELSLLKEQCNLVSRSIIEIQNKGKQELDSLMKENLNLKKEINEFKIRLMREDREAGPSYKEDLLKVVSEHTSVKSEMIELKSQMQHMEEMLTSERGLLQEYRERNAGLEQQILKLTVEGKQKEKAEGGAGAEGKQLRKRGAGREDELAWTNLYGIKRAGKGREGSVCLEDYLFRGEGGGNGEGRPPNARSGSIALDHEYERSREEVRQRVDASFQAEEERKARQVLQSCELLELKRQIVLLQNRIADEKSARCGLETKMAEMEAEVREKRRLEVEVSNLRRRIERELVPRSELEVLKQEREVQRKSRRRRQQEEEEGGYESDLPGGDYKAKCERFARELENSKRLRKRMESEANGVGSVPRKEGGGRCESAVQEEPRGGGGAAEVLRPLRFAPAAGRSSSSDLEPEVKSKLNEELDRSIKRHLTDLAVVSEPEMDLFSNKFLQ